MTSNTSPYAFERGANDVELSTSYDIGAFENPPAGTDANSVDYCQAALTGGRRTIEPIFELFKHPVDSVIQIVKLPFTIDVKGSASALFKYVRGAVIEDESITSQERITRQFHLFTEVSTFVAPVVLGRVVAGVKQAQQVGKVGLSKPVVTSVSQKIPYINSVAVTESEVALQQSLIKLANKLEMQSNRSLAQLATEATGWRAEVLVQAVARCEKNFLQFLDVKLPGNQGFDVVSVFGKNMKAPSRIVVTESKSSLARRLKQPITRELNVFKDGTRQMDASRIQSTMETMLAGPKATSNTQNSAKYMLQHWEKVEFEVYGFEQATDNLYHLSLQEEKILIPESWLSQTSRKFLDSKMVFKVLEPTMSHATESAWLVAHLGSELKALSCRQQSHASIVSKYMEDRHLPFL